MSLISMSFQACSENALIDDHVHIISLPSRIQPPDLLHYQTNKRASKGILQGVGEEFVHLRNSG
jgi:hypothetical protein